LAARSDQQNSKGLYWNRRDAVVEHAGGRNDHDRQEKNRRHECGAGSMTTDARQQPGVACSYCTVKPS
jgi:hypothetical protein